MHEHETVCSSCGTDFSVAAVVWPDSQDFARAMVARFDTLEWLSDPIRGRRSRFRYLGTGAETKGKPTEDKVR